MPTSLKKKIPVKKSKQDLSTGEEGRDRPTQTHPPQENPDQDLTTEFSEDVLLYGYLRVVSGDKEIINLPVHTVLAGLFDAESLAEADTRFDQIVDMMVAMPLSRKMKRVWYDKFKSLQERIDADDGLGMPVNNLAGLLPSMTSGTESQQPFDEGEMGAEEIQPPTTETPPKNDGFQKLA